MYLPSAAKREFSQPLVVSVSETQIEPFIVNVLQEFAVPQVFNESIDKPQVLVAVAESYLMFG